VEVRVRRQDRRPARRQRLRADGLRRHHDRLVQRHREGDRPRPAHGYRVRHERSARAAVLREARRADLPRPRDRRAAQLLRRDRQDDRRGGSRDRRSSFRASHPDSRGASRSARCARAEADRRGDGRQRSLRDDLRRPPAEGGHPRAAAATPPPGGRAGRGSRPGAQARGQAEVLAGATSGLIIGRSGGILRHPPPGRRPGALIPSNRGRGRPGRYHARMTIAAPTVETFLESTRDRRLESYFELLRIPSISTLSEHAPDMVRAAEWIAAEMRRIGLEHVEVSPAGGHPVVYGDWLHAPDAPTILVYCHYDVQPVDPIDLWETAPFDPFVKDGRVVGRGSADDKGQLHMHLKAAEAVLATRGELPLNLRYTFEGEEESTSANLPGWLEANRERLAADAVVISDTGFFEGNVPAITTSLRGLLYTQIDVVGSPVDLHSGGFGGAVQNPANALAKIIAALKADDGTVLVPGFYDDVEPASKQERFELSCLPFDEEAFRAQTGVPALVAGEPGFSVLECMGVRPTL